MPYKPGLGQGRNQKKDTHTLDFDVSLNEALPEYVFFAIYGKLSAKGPLQPVSLDQ